MPTRNKCFYRAFSIDRRGGLLREFFLPRFRANSRRCVSIWRGRAPRGNGWRMSEACSGDVLLGPGVDPRNGEPPAVYQARAGGGLFGVWPSALQSAPLDTPATRAVCGFMHSAIHAASSSGLLPSASRYNPPRGLRLVDAVRLQHHRGGGRSCSHLTVRHGGEIGGAPRTLQRAQKSARPSDFARGSTGPLGGGQRAARRQGGLERGGCLGMASGGSGQPRKGRDGGRGRATTSDSSSQTTRACLFLSSQTHKQTPFEPL